MVDISLEHRKRDVTYHFTDKDRELTQQLADKLNKELQDLLKGVILFGSAVRGEKVEKSDIDVLLIINDLSVVLSKEVVASLRVIIENTAGSVSDQFHITSMHLSEFWEYARQGDPVIVNILRDGAPIYDAGFFGPVQLLLDQGKIRPTKEAVWSYYTRAPQTIKNAKKHMLQALVDLYWATIDAAHAALMHIDVVPGAPHEVADLLDKHFVKKKLLDAKYVRILRKFYALAKDIGHEKLLHISGKKVDTYISQANDFVKRMKFLMSHNPQKIKKL